MKNGMLNELRNARINKGLTQRDVAQHLGLKDNTISNYEKGKTEPDIQTLSELCSMYEISCSELLNRYYQKEDNRKELYPTEKEALVLTKYRDLDERGKGAVDNTLEYEHTQSQLRKKAHDTKEKHMEEYAEENVIEFKELPQYDLPVSAGTGEFLDNDNYELVNVPVNADTMKANFIVRVTGDSMEPEFSHGDNVLVKQQPHLEFGQIGIFTIDNEGFIKKYGEEGLISLNPEYPIRIPKEYENFRIVGKVIGKLEV